jgi:hypothetical protein
MIGAKNKNQKTKRGVSTVGTISFVIFRKIEVHSAHRISTSLTTRNSQ